jgi:hypothetical protein
VPELYDLAAITVGELLSKDLRLPRFQRKSTWSEEARFQLALSLFKGYPMGTVVLKQGKSIVNEIEVDATYLLDGRQRKETFERMMNPEELYRWAAVTLRLRGKTSQEEVINSFREYVNDYFFGLEDWEVEPHLEEREAAAPPDEVPLQEAAPEDGEEAVPEQAPQSVGDGSSGLELLQQVILAVHPIKKKGRSSRLREPFDFSKLIEPEYLERDDLSRKYVAMDSLLSWLRIQRERERAKGNDSFPPSQEVFEDWLLAYAKDDKTAQKVRQLLNDRWPEIGKSLAIIRAIDLKVRQSSVGLVEIREKATPEDEKKIFEIINTAGAKLTAAEILSATPAWDMPLEEAPARVQSDARSLYKELKVEFSEPIRRWDVAATLLDRIVPQAPIVFGDPEAWQWHGINAKQFERKVTLGFKVMSGYYQQKLMKSHVAQLPANAHVAWDTVALESLIENAQKRLRDHWFFTYLNAWQFSFASSVSDAVALDFLLETAMDFEAKGSPTGGSALGSFRKNAIQLFDRLVLEYLTDAWRGSSDSRIARNLENLKARPANKVVAPVDPSAWEELLNDISRGELGGRSYLGRQDPRIRLLLVYASTIMELRPDDAREGCQVDHIVPQKLFRQESESSASQLMHHIGNLQLLPEKINTFKTDERLKDLTNQNVIDAVEKFSRIKREVFAEYSAVSSVSRLVELRTGLLRRVLTEDRSRMLADPDDYSAPSYWITEE